MSAQDTAKPALADLVRAGDQQQLIPGDRE